MSSTSFPLVGHLVTFYPKTDPTNPRFGVVERSEPERGFIIVREDNLETVKLDLQPA